MDYPKCLYHADCEPLTVKDEAQHKAVGPLWAESPAEALELKAKAQKPNKASAKEGTKA